MPSNSLFEFFEIVVQELDTSTSRIITAFDLSAKGRSSSLVDDLKTLTQNLWLQLNQFLQLTDRTSLKSYWVDQTLLLDKNILHHSSILLYEENILFLLEAIFKSTAIDLDKGMYSKLERSLLR